MSDSFEGEGGGEDKKKTTEGEEKQNKEVSKFEYMEWGREGQRSLRDYY